MLFASRIFGSELCHSMSTKNLNASSTATIADAITPSTTGGATAPSTKTNETTETAYATTTTADASRVQPTPFHLPLQLQQIIGLVFWYPTIKKSSAEDVSYVTGMHCGRNSEDKRSKPIQYFGDIQSMCRKYTHNINLCYENGGTWAKELDKPNSHRLLELAFHTIPMYGHALNVSELVLEQVHREFKDWLEKNSHHDSHLSAVENAVGQDWLRRVYALFKIWQGGNLEEKQIAERGLVRLFLGEEAVEYMCEGTSHSATKDLKEFRTSLVDSFAEPVMQQIGNRYRSTLLNWECERWEFKNEKAYPSEGCQLQLFNSCLQQLRAFLAVRNNSSQVEFKSYASACLRRKYLFLPYRSTSSFNNISPGHFVSAKVHNPQSSILQPHPDCKSVHFYCVRFIVHATGNNDDEAPWILVTGLQHMDNENTFYCGHEETTALQCMELTTSVCRVGKLHSCKSRCKSVFADNRVSVIHDGSNYWHVLSPRDGFPPHMG